MLAYLIIVVLLVAAAAWLGGSIWGARLPPMPADRDGDEEENVERTGSSRR